jgi:hypothetical protein
MLANPSFVKGAIYLLGKMRMETVLIGVMDCFRKNLSLFLLTNLNSEPLTVIPECVKLAETTVDRI